MEIFVFGEAPSPLGMAPLGLVPASFFLKSIHQAHWMYATNDKLFISSGNAKAFNAVVSLYRPGVTGLAIMPPLPKLAENVAHGGDRTIH